MYSFEGKYKSKPEQSLRGASKRLLKDQLIQNAAQDRKLRQELRSQTKAAIIIQSHYRSYLTRKLLCDDLRNQFDQDFNSLNACSQNDGLILLKCITNLLIFYNDSLDCSRLTSFGQTFIKLKCLIVDFLSKDLDQWLYRIKKLLYLNIKQMSQLIKSDPNSFPISLRLIEVYTARETYSSTIDDQTFFNQILPTIWFFLIEKDYFSFIRLIIDIRVPEPYEETTKPLTPITETLFNLLIKPLNLNCKNFRLIIPKIVKKFFEQFLKGPLSPQIKLFFIPKLIQKIPLFLKPTHILTFFFVDSTSSTSAKLSFTMSPNIWLLYSVVKFISSQLNLLSFEERFKYLCILQHLSQSFPEEIEKSESDDYIEETEQMDVQEDDKNNSLTQGLNLITSETLALINESNHVECLIYLIENRVYYTNALIPICHLCNAILATSKLAVLHNRLLYTLAFRPTFIRQLWSYVTSISTLTVFDTTTSLLQIISKGVSTDLVDWSLLLPQLTLFCTLFSYLLPTLNDVEFYQECDQTSHPKSSLMPFSLEELQNMTLLLKDVCIGLISLAYHDTKLVVPEEYQEAMNSVRTDDSFENKEDGEKNVKQWLRLFKSSVKLLQQLYIRDSRRSFCPSNHWISKQVTISVEKPTNFRIGMRQRQRYRQFVGLRRLTREELEEQGPSLSINKIRNITILQEIPFVVPFHDRVKILQALMTKDKSIHTGNLHEFMIPGYSFTIIVRRNFIYEDAFEKLSLENAPDLKKPIRVQLVNAVGLDEAGIDGGGIFREFLSELLKTCFDPNRGFFRTTQNRLLYPNPASSMLVENYQKHFFFIGRMLGKALYENMLVELPFASFFLAKILAKHQTSDIDIHHLATLDPLMYKNLVYLKNYEGDVAELGLDFTVVNSDLGENQIVELKPGGSNIQVNASNRIEYIHLMANYRLNKQIRAHCSAFKQGLANVIDLNWIEMFGPRELQTLISGAQTPIDLQDLKNHTNYSGGYSPTHPTILAFWSVVENFTETERRQLLKFVTSCSRPPLLGFKDLHPALCIQFAGRENRLPTASTCMNLLKLPEFNDANTLKQKLLYAIESGVGFELS